MKPLIVTGTDTGVGKTIVCAMLMLALHGIYWKPIQAGTEEATDTERVRELTLLPDSHFLPEAYRLSTPCSPHRSAEIDGVTIDLARLQLPNGARNVGRLIVETAGGVLVPLTRSDLQIDLIAHWQAPVVVVARTALGTINHTLLTLEALRSRGVDVLGVMFVGEAMPDTEKTIAVFGRVKQLGRLPQLDTLDASTLTQAFAAHFNTRDFEGSDGG